MMAKRKDPRPTGRPPIEDERLRRVHILLRLPSWIIDWLREQPESSTWLIENAVMRQYRLKGKKPKPKPKIHRKKPEPKPAVWQARDHWD